MNKPTVIYTGSFTHFNGRAIVVPKNHPNPHGLVSNTKEVITSSIVQGPDENGRFETKNTIYVKEQE